MEAGLERPAGRGDPRAAHVDDPAAMEAGHRGPAGVAAEAPPTELIIHWPQWRPASRCRLGRHDGPRTKPARAAAAMEAGLGPAKGFFRLAAEPHDGLAAMEAGARARRSPGRRASAHRPTGRRNGGRARARLSGGARHVGVIAVQLQWRPGSEGARLSERQASSDSSVAIWPQWKPGLPGLAPSSHAFVVLACEFGPVRALSTRLSRGGREEPGWLSGSAHTDFTVGQPEGRSRPSPKWLSAPSTSGPVMVVSNVTSTWWARRD
jgi:hypothetical protein